MSTAATVTPLRRALIEGRYAEHASPEGQAALAEHQAEANRRLTTVLPLMQYAGDRALAAQSRVAKVMWLRKVADEFSKAIAPMTPCAKGCSACCRQSVIVSEDEAGVIGREIGVKPQRPPRARALDPAEIKARIRAGMRTEEVLAEQNAYRAMVTAHFSNVPCSFLKGDGTCSIYAIRPMPCRTHFTADRDNLLCQFEGGEATTTLYFNARQIHELYANVLAPDDGITGDIRDFFPHGRATS